MIILGKTLDTTTSNPDDDPDPTPPSNGGDTPEVSAPAPKTTTQPITIIPEYATLHNGNIDITDMSLTPEELHSRMGFTVSKLEANYRVITNSTKGTFSFICEGNKHPLCAYDIRTDKFTLLNDGDSRSKNNMTLIERVFRQRITEFFSLPSQKAIQNSDTFSVGSGKNKKTYHIITRRPANPYLARLYGVILDICNSDNEVIAGYAPLWYGTFSFSSKCPTDISKPALKNAFMKKIPLLLRKFNLSDDNGRILSDGNEDLRNAVDEWCNTWGHNIGNFPIHEYDRKHQHELVQEVNTEPETPQVQPIPNRENLEAICWQVYSCTNPEDMRAILDIFNTKILTAMCRIVHAPIKSNSTKTECINAFIAEVIAHKAKQFASVITPDYDAAFDEPAYTPDRQDNLAVLDDIPADHEPETQPASKHDREPWQKHTCDHCDGTPATWTHEQFIKGILLIYEHDKLKHKPHEHIGICEYLKRNYSLVQLWNLARFFGLNIPKIELNSKNNKSDRKKYQIADIIGNEILDMQHVYVCTYECTGAPELPAELAEHIPEWRKEFIARTQAMTAPKPKHQPMPTPKREPRKSAPKPATRKPRHVKKIDNSRQLLICFDDEETPAPTSTPAKKKIRRVSRPRIKRDYSRQLLIDFGIDIVDSQSNQRKTA